MTRSLRFCCGIVLDHQLFREVEDDGGGSPKFVQGGGGSPCSTPRCCCWTFYRIIIVLICACSIRLRRSILFATSQWSSLWLTSSNIPQDPTNFTTISTMMVQLSIMIGDGTSSQTNGDIFIKTIPTRSGLVGLQGTKSN